MKWKIEKILCKKFASLEFESLSLGALYIVLAFIEGFVSLLLSQKQKFYTYYCNNLRDLLQPTNVCTTNGHGAWCTNIQTASQT